MLEAAEISYFYGEKLVLQGINLQVRPGEIVALIGPNGSGKSTLLRCLAGLYIPQQGRVALDGKDIGKYNRKAIAKRIALLPQNLESIQHISVRELVARGRCPHQKTGWGESEVDRKKIDLAISSLDLDRFKDRPLHKLSGGERQRAWIAMVIAQDTEYILLDEPVNYLDIKYQWDLLQTIAGIRDELQKCFILVLHDINHALSVADRVFVLKAGQVCREGKADEVITDALIQEVYGICVRVCRFDGCRRQVVVPGVG